MASPVLLIVATPELVELQVTELVMFTVPPSLYVPVAVYCCVAPLLIEAFAGVTAIDTSVAVTVRFVDPLIEPDAAEIVVVPVLTPVASPAPLIVPLPYSSNSRSPNLSSFGCWYRYRFPWR